MATPVKQKLIVYQGSTFSEIIRWETPKKIYKPISDISSTAPAIVTSTAHGIPNGWRVKLGNIAGMKELNSTSIYHNIIVISTDTFELNDINAVGYTPYTTGGIVEYYEPKNLTGYTARLQIRPKLDSTEILLELTTENAGIVIDNVDKTISLYISAINTAIIDWTSGVYSLELVSSTGVVETILNGDVVVKREVTR